MPRILDADQPRPTDDVLIVIAEHDFQPSLQDSRVRELFARGDALLAQLAAEHADFYRRSSRSNVHARGLVAGISTERPGTVDLATIAAEIVEKYETHREAVHPPCRTRGCSVLPGQMTSPSRSASGQRLVSSGTTATVANACSSHGEPVLPVRCSFPPLPSRAMSSEIGGSHSFVDLFSGAGGLSLGFARAGLESIVAIDSDRYAIETYCANFGDHAVCGDIRAIGSLPSARVVVGGPPCQGFSRLGKKAKKERHENHLWQEYMRYVATARPEIFVIENVPEFLRDAAFSGVRKESARLGYEIVFGLLNAADYGVPQRRIRAFVIGSRIGSPALPAPTHRQPGAEGLFEEVPRWRTVKDAIGDLPLEPTNQNLHNSRSVSALSLERYKHVPPGGNRKNLPDRLQPPCWLNKSSKSGGSTDLFGRLLWDAPALTIRTGFLKPEKGRYLHPEAHRSLTLREGARLQTFPDDFVFCGSAFQIAKQIGNAVPVELARQIALSVRELLVSADEASRSQTPTVLPAAA